MILPRSERAIMFSLLDGTHGPFEVDVWVSQRVRHLLYQRLMPPKRLTTTELVEHILPAEWITGDEGLKASKRLRQSLLRLARSTDVRCSLADCAQHDGREWVQYGRKMKGWTWGRANPDYKWLPVLEDEKLFSAPNLCPHCGGIID